MSGKTNITIDVRIRTRADMNSGTPRVGNWTYHHVQPVRIYYLAASTILRFITDVDCFGETRVLATNALCKMCNNVHNQATVRTFVDQNRDAVTTDDQRNVVAKLLASPPFGGFSGMNPTQRSDDPHDAPEPMRPHSASAGWWEGLNQIGDEILAAFGLHLMPAPNTNLSATKQAHAWNELVLSLVGNIELAALNGGHAFDRKDWKLTNGANWTIPAAADRPQFPARPAGGPVFPTMALRPRAEQYSYLDPSAVPVASLVNRGTTALQVRAGGSDYIDYV